MITQHSSPAVAGAGEFLASCRPLIDAQLDRLIPKESVAPERVHAAIRWSLFAGGKRFRPALLMATGQTFGANPERLLGAACALEMIHTYSLIHDDLPSMDNDDLRRGRPTCHVQFDEAHAILAGDALQTLAFQTIAEDERLSPTLRVQLISEVSRAAGTPEGMVAGQAHDLDAESRDVSNEELERIHHLKTGALIRTAARCGALIARASDGELEADVTATAADLGKTPGKDARSRKATYPALYGIRATRAHLDAVHGAARDALKNIEAPTELLLSITDLILERHA